MSCDTGERPGLWDVNTGSLRTQGHGNELEDRDESVTAGDHVLGHQSVTGGQVSEEGGDETFSIASLRFRLQGLRIHEEWRRGTETREKKREDAYRQGRR